MSARIIAGAVGNCVHVAGVYGFLHIAEELGYETQFLGAAVTIEGLISHIRKTDPDIVGISYRLTPQVAERILNDLKARLDSEGLANRRFVFGGTPPVCEVAERMGWFERCFSGHENLSDVRAYLSENASVQQAGVPGGTLLQRIAHNKPFPLLRHHFGLPDLEETIAGVARIAGSGVLDVISIAPDQNAQESFFRQQDMNSALDGAGGVPLRTSEDLHRIYVASQRGNYPLLRIYSGTRDLVQWAELSTKSIKNAWGAVPLCWYSALDGRSHRTPKEAIRENQDTMRWYGEHHIPLEVNEAHHWSMRDAHDTVAVVMAYIAAYNAKAMGVRDYVAQYMFNSPAMTTAAMDLAKMLAKIQMIEQLHDSDFHSYRQVRAGLLHLSANPNIAKGQLAASTMLAMQLRPDIVHVVGYCEADHAARPQEVIESCEIVRGVCHSCVEGLPDMSTDMLVEARKDELLDDARTLLDALAELSGGYDDHLTNPDFLAYAIREGLLDAPQLKGNTYASGRLCTKSVRGAIYPYDPISEKILNESERLETLHRLNDQTDMQEENNVRNSCNRATA